MQLRRTVREYVLHPNFVIGVEIDEGDTPQRIFLSLARHGKEVCLGPLGSDEIQTLAEALDNILGEIDDAEDTDRPDDKEAVAGEPS